VNNNDFYERREDRALPEHAPQTPTDNAVAALAVHRDPSLVSPQNVTDPGREQPTVAWVRPTDMPTLFGSKVVRRGIDLQSELARRACRAPGRATKRITRRAIARPEATTPTATHQEELGL